MIVIVLLMYLFGVFMTTGTSSYLAERNFMLNHNADEHSILLQRFFGTVDQSMLSLFQTICGGRDWYEFYDVLLKLDDRTDSSSMSKRWIFLLYISFATFAVSNVVAAVFVESAMQSSAHDR